MSGSDGMHHMYAFWLTPHLAEAEATAKLIHYVSAGVKVYSARKAWSVQSITKPSSFVCHVGSGSLSALPCIALQQAYGLAH